MGRLLDAFLRHYDTLHQGYTPAGLGFGVCATVGRGWCIPGSSGAEEVACVAVFRGINEESEIDFDRPVGMALGKATTVTTFDYTATQREVWHIFAGVPYNGAGVPSDQPREPQRLLSDDSSDIIDPPVPNAPAYVSAEQRPGGKIGVHIGYSPWGEVVSPTDLQVYGKQVDGPDDPDVSDLFDGGNLLTDAERLASSIPVEPMTTRYTFNVEALTVGQYWVFGAVFRNATTERAINATGYSRVIRIDTAGGNLPAEFYVS